MRYLLLNQFFNLGKIPQGPPPNVEMVAAQQNMMQDPLNALQNLASQGNRQQMMGLSGGPGGGPVNGPGSGPGQQMATPGGPVAASSLLQSLNQQRPGQQQMPQMQGLRPQMTMGNSGGGNVTVAGGGIGAVGGNPGGLLSGQQQTTMLNQMNGPGGIPINIMAAGGANSGVSISGGPQGQMLNPNQQMTNQGPVAVVGSASGVGGASGVSGSGLIPNQLSQMGGTSQGVVPNMSVSVGSGVGNTSNQMQMGVSGGTGTLNIVSGGGVGNQMQNGPMNVNAMNVQQQMSAQMPQQQQQQMQQMNMQHPQINQLMAARMNQASGPVGNAVVQVVPGGMNIGGSNTSSGMPVLPANMQQNPTSIAANSVGPNHPNAVVGGGNVGATQQGPGALMPNNVVQTGKI